MTSAQLPLLVAKFGVTGDGLEFKELPAYDDLNFCVLAAGAERYVLKVHNGLLASSTRGRLEAQNRLIARLREKGLPVPGVVAAPTGESIFPLDSPSYGAGAPHARLLTYLDGEIVPNETAKGPAFLQTVGELVGRVAAALAGFEDEGAHYTWDWDMKRVPEVVRSKLSFIADERRRELAGRLADEYARVLDEAAVAALPHSVLHSDLNDTNLLFRGGEVVGVIDFGDSIYSCTAFEPAIAAGYYTLGQADPMMVFREVLRGYCRAAPSPLSEQETVAYFHAARGRVLLSVAFAAENLSLEPDNDYLAHTAEPGWATLERLRDVSTEAALAALLAP